MPRVFGLRHVELVNDLGRRIASWFIAPCPRELRHRASKTHTGCRLSLVTQGEGRDPQWTFNIRNQLTLV